MKTLLAIIAIATLSLTLSSCASAARVKTLQKQLNKYQKLDSLAQDIMSRNNVADMDGGDAMAEWLEMHN
jgi:outer membrane lipoprotein-sorting protein